jgi:1,4-alpha-glucan branching enzyme/maltooligosyltrehalose trehalohydrolase
MQETNFAPLIQSDTVIFRLWAPFQDQVTLKINGRDPEPMQAIEDGWHQSKLSGVEPGALYRFLLGNDLEVPDPASRFQPQDINGPSELVDLSAYHWRHPEWVGRAWEDMVIYEIHVGTFTPEGSFLGAIDKLDHLRDLGITAIQLMPIADFPGRYGWGYDGVLPYAPDSSYGRPEDLMALVDAAHERGICVFLDVVYNHFGPDGNYLPSYAPLFTDHHKTPWGNGINYDAEQSEWVREFIVQNAIYWTTQFKLDGLRLDAVHAIKDDNDEHLLLEIARRVRAACAGRHVHLILENEDNDSDLLRRSSDGASEHFTAQWNDDIHHVLHIAATGETFGYYADYADDPRKLGRALAEGFVFQGEHMPYRGESRGKPSAELPPTAFVSFIHNHDQIGNRALGDRIIAAQSHEVIKALATVYLLAPQIPMLFMGEEWNARSPFPYFCDFNEELNEKVRTGRREELSRLPGFDAENLPDPTTPATFESAKLDWSLTSEADGASMLAFYRKLLALRRETIVPYLLGAPGHSGSMRAVNEVLKVEWHLSGAKLSLLANLSSSASPTSGVQDHAGEVIFSLGGVSDGTLAPWSVLWSLET